MNTTFGSVLKGFLSNFAFTNISDTISGVPEIIKNIKQVFDKQGQKVNLSPDFNMIVSCMTMQWYVGGAISLILLILSALVAGFTLLGVIAIGGSLIATVISLAISLLIYSAIIYWLQKNNCTISSTVYKIFGVLYLISVLSMVWSLGSAVVSLISARTAITIAIRLLSVISAAVSLVAICRVIKGMALATSDVNTQNYDSETVYNQGFSQQENVYQNQGYQPPSLDLNKQNPYNNQQSYGNNQGYNQQGFDAQGYSQPQRQAPQPQVQMFGCPYCNQAIPQYQSPCSHCGKNINWG